MQGEKGEVCPEKRPPYRRIPVKVIILSDYHTVHRVDVETIVQFAMIALDFKEKQNEQINQNTGGLEGSL